MDTIRLYTVTHKQFVPPTDPLYVPIQVGKPFTKKTLGYISDDTGDNIASKNKNYCELTALYWIWKNDRSDITGLCHYRRYFSNEYLSADSRYFLKEKQIRRLLKRYEAIVPEKIWFSESVRDQLLGTSCKEKDLRNLEAVIRQRCPEYREAFDQVFEGSGMHSCNMIIAGKPLLDRYCEWLFDVLGALEEVTDLTGYSDYEKRIYGFLAERLLNVWLIHNQVHIAQFPVVNIEDPELNKHGPWLWWMLHRGKNIWKIFRKQWMG